MVLNLPDDIPPTALSAFAERRSVMLCDSRPREVAALDGTTDIEHHLIGRDHRQRNFMATAPLLQLSHRTRWPELSNRHEPHTSTLRDLCDSLRRKQ